MKEIYLDNSATTPLSEAAKQKMTEAMERYGNPSSLHSAGQAAEKLVAEAREQILLSLGLRPRQKDGVLVFTSCGTEATSLALFGSAYAKERRQATRILTTDSEHPSVARALDRLAADGFEVIRIPTKNGVLDLGALDAALEQKIFLASFMLVNNETGAIYGVGEAFRRIKQRYPEAITHCDAVQGFLKIPFTPATLSADLITVSGHKLHAPKGVGALYISSAMLKAKKIVPFLVGGGQEDGMRSGTENVIGIAAFGASVKELREQKTARAEHMRALRQYAEDKLASLDLRINRPARDYLPHIINVTLPHIKSETMLHALSADGIFVSSGSACSSHSHHPSDSLLAFGLTPHEADCSLRISFSDYNTEADIDALCASLSKGIDTLVRIK
ncbi:MAG: cysteine desulfurase [Clostridia bacterium]|nr:cysteine desulfurase [Clostridia bacterium]